MMLPAPLVSGSFFEALSNLFYAVSVADSVLVLEEKKAIHKEITDYWLYNVDGHPSWELMFACMRQLISDVTEDEDAFEVFKNFYLKEQNHFTMDLKKAIYDSANAIANSFSRKNKAELRVLAQLKLLFSE